MSESRNVRNVSFSNMSPDESMHHESSMPFSFSITLPDESMQQGSSMLFIFSNMVTNKSIYQGSCMPSKQSSSSNINDFVITDDDDSDEINRIDQLRKELFTMTLSKQEPAASYRRSIKNRTRQIVHASPTIQSKRESNWPISAIDRQHAQRRDLFRRRSEKRIVCFLFCFLFIVYQYYLTFFKD